MGGLGTDHMSSIRKCRSIRHEIEKYDEADRYMERKWEAFHDLAMALLDQLQEKVSA